MFTQMYNAEEHYAQEKLRTVAHREYLGKGEQPVSDYRWDRVFGLADISPQKGVKELGALAYSGLQAVDVTLEKGTRFVQDGY